MAWTDKYIDLADGGSGDGSTGDPWASYAEALAEIGSITAPTRVFVRGNGSLSANLDFNVAGSSANPLHWIGCTGTGTTWTRIGDDGAAAKPLLTCSTYTITASQSYQTFEGLAFSGSPTTRLVLSIATFLNWKRCRIVNTGTNANSVGLYLFSSQNKALGCYVEADNTTATYAIQMGATEQAVVGCIVKGGGTAGIWGNQTQTFISHNIVFGMGDPGSGIYHNCGGTFGVIQNNTVYGGHSDGITIPDGYPLVINNLLVGTGNMDYPINFTNATASSKPIIAYNAWYNVANDKINGIIETQSTHDGAANDNGSCWWNYGLLANDPLPNASAIGNVNDFDLASTCKALGFPGVFEAGGGYAYTGYLDHGAVQRVEPEGGGGGARIIGG